uniref:CSON007165 protein n=1 Tax=Culicoides sonorensis TaxID=179676 RepID=A0A336LIV7_CULSO
MKEINLNVVELACDEEEKKCLNVYCHNMSGQKSSTRSRAFSVGSKIKNRLNENTFKLDLKEKTGKNVQGDKSTSVPVLAKNSKFLTSDHVEVVFSNPTNQQIKFLPSGLTTSEYIEMLPTNYIISELPQVINSDYVDMGVNFSKSERCSSKPIEIKKKKNDNFDDYNMLSSCLQNDDVPGNECQNTIFALSLENKFTLDTDLSHRSNGSKKSSDGTESQQTNSSIKENNAKHDDGDYATLLSNAEVENKNCDEKNICIQNYVDLYFPEKSNIKYANSKKEENVPKSTYAQISSKRRYVYESTMCNSYIH